MKVTIGKGIVAGALVTTAALLMRSNGKQKRGIQESLQTVPSVDLKKYAGCWYEIARLPTRYEKSCASDVRATYTLRADGKVEVLNECRKASGEMKQAKGTATVIDEKTNAKLKVSFFWPFSGDYWILDLDESYSQAIVGTPDRKNLWILSRRPEMDQVLYLGLLNKVMVQGFDTSKVMKTQHTSTEHQSVEL